MACNIWCEVAKCHMFLLSTNKIMKLGIGRQGLCTWCSIAWVAEQHCKPLDTSPIYNYCRIEILMESYREYMYACLNPESCIIVSYLDVHIGLMSLILRSL